jgi:type III secretory pathway component EscV
MRNQKGKFTAGKILGTLVFRKGKSIAGLISIFANIFSMTNPNNIHYQIFVKN